jgi:CRISPR type I-D-associated protein Csc2
MATKLSHLSAVPILKDYVVDAPRPLAGMETVQLCLIREVQDFTILRTEETRELNTVWTPEKADGSGEVQRVAFLATKQKGAESRELEALLRTWNAGEGRSAAECYLKAKLCLACPRCILFGGTDVSKGKKGANIKHRIAYATAFSLAPVGSLREVHTFNGVDGATQLTGQTLGDRESVRPGALFASIVTLRSVTEVELLLALKTVLSCTRYGAETRIGGLVRNHLVGVVAAYEEVLSPLELTLALSAGPSPSPETVKTALDEFATRCGTPGKAKVLPSAELDGLVKAVQDKEVDKALLDGAYEAAGTFRKAQADYVKKAKKD